MKSAASLTAIAASLLLAACGGANAQISGPLEGTTRGPAGDYPMVLGAPFVVDGVTYTPADTMNYDSVGYARSGGRRGCQRSASHIAAAKLCRSNLAGKRTNDSGAADRTRADVRERSGVAFAGSLGPAWGACGCAAGRAGAQGQSARAGAGAVARGGECACADGNAAGAADGTKTQAGRACDSACCCGGRGSCSQTCGDDQCEACACGQG